MMTDPIADMLTRIRNASEARKRDVVIPFSKLKHRLALLLKQEGYLENVSETSVDGKPSLSVVIRYDKNGKSAISRVRRISTPGRRVYTTHEELPIVQSGYGVAVISTPQGLLTNKEARLRGVGGEIICEIN